MAAIHSLDIYAHDNAIEVPDDAYSEIEVELFVRAVRDLVAAYELREKATSAEARRMSGRMSRAYDATACAAWRLARRFPVLAASIHDQFTADKDSYRALRDAAHLAIEREAIIGLRWALRSGRERARR
jgi:hypothetical protein